MTKKDYVLIAQAIKKPLDDISAFPEETSGKSIDISAVKAVVKSLVISLQENNPRFDSEKFLSACRVLN